MQDDTSGLVRLYFRRYPMANKRRSAARSRMAARHACLLPECEKDRLDSIKYWGPEEGFRRGDVRAEYKEGGWVQLRNTLHLDKLSE
jgi:hypothetical protein